MTVIKWRAAPVPCLVRVSGRMHVNSVFDSAMMYEVCVHGRGCMHRGGRPATGQLELGWGRGGGGGTGGVG